MGRHPANTGGASGLLVAADAQHTTWSTDFLIDRAEKHTTLLHRGYQPGTGCLRFQPPPTFTDITRLSMSSPDQKTEKPEEREDGQLVERSTSEAERQNVEDLPKLSTGAEDQEQHATATGETSQAAVAAPTESDPPTKDSEENPLGISLPKGSAASSDTDTQESRKQIEDEATLHLAQRAAALSMDEGHSEATEATTENEEQDELPASPPPPPVPQKYDVEQPAKRKGKATSGSDSEEKNISEESDSQEVPEAPQGTAEQTGEEIQTIMHQFQEDEALGEQEIMSPRLEKQQPIFHLPPRTSSLENQESHNEEPKPGIERRATETFFGSPLVSKPSSIISPLPERKESADDNASITSRRTSLFQPPPPSPDPEPPAAFDFHKFLEQLRHRTADPVARYLRSFLQEFVKKQWAVHEQVKIIGDFLEFITNKMAQCEVWATLNDDEFDNAREGMEKLVMNRLYSQTFSPAIPAPATPTTPRKGRSNRHATDAANPNGPGRRGQHEEDVERDDVIAQKMRIYGWIQPEHLDIQPVTGEKPQKFLKMAQAELLKINTYRAPRDKVICVLNTCKVLFGYLKSSKADQSADAFVPLLIYTVLRAAPEHLVSNVQYIWRFRNQDKLGGEAGYYMSSLMGVVTFIEGLDRTSLTISDEDFEHNVEQAVSAIAEGHRTADKEKEKDKPLPTAPVPGLHHLSEKSTPSRPEVTPRNSMDGERSSPRKSSSNNNNQRAHSSQRQRQRQQHQNQTQHHQQQQQSSDTIYGTGMQDEEFDAVGGLLRSIQKPLSSIGRIFSDDGASSSSDRQSPPPIPPRMNSSSLPGNNNNNNSNSTARERTDEERQLARAEREALKRASVEAEEGRKARARELRLVVETLQGMFPNLDQEVIVDVVRAQDGHVGRAVDACLALTTT
ncbi:hypothetical protein Q7P35_010159 [Cladosporium inversicolor]